MKSLISIFFFVLSGCWCNIFAQYRITDDNNVLSKKEKSNLERVIGYQLNFYRQVFPEDSLESSAVKLTIFDSYPAYLLYRKEQNPIVIHNCLGFYSTKNKEAVVCKDKNSERFMETAYHEISHFFTNTYFTNIPVWLNEGLAVYFSRFNISKKSIKPEPHQYYIDRVKTLIAIHDINLTDFFRWNQRRFVKESFTNDSYGYALAYAVVWFIMQSDENLMIDYIRHLKSTENGLICFDVVYPGGFKAFETDFFQYFARK